MTRRPLSRAAALILKFLITLPVIAFLVFETFANRSKSVDLTWSPLHADLPISVPVLIFMATIFGFVWGCLILWSNSLPLRADRMALRKKVAELDHRLESQRLEYESRLARKNDAVLPPRTADISPVQVEQLRSVTPGFMP